MRARPYVRAWSRSLTDAVQLHELPLRESWPGLGTLALMTTTEVAGIDLYWLPQGAGGNSVRLNGRVFEAIVSRLEHRPACDLYHSALEVRVAEGRFVIEMTPGSRSPPVPPGLGARVLFADGS